MKAAPDTPSGKLLSQLGSWMSILDFEQAMTAYFLGERSKEEVAAFRAKKGAMKKLRDEVSPVLHHIRFTQATGDIRFELNSNIPDCWLRANASAQPQGLELTCAQSYEQHILGEEMNKGKVTPGFLGLPLDAKPKFAEAKLARGRVMYTSDSALKAVGTSIKQCLTKKNKAKFAGHNLLIEAPLSCLPRQRWAQIEDDLKQAASVLPFKEIHIIGDQDTKPFGFRIK